MEDEYLEKRNNIFLDVVEAKVELGEVGQGDEGGAGNLLQVIVVQIEDAEVSQTLETVLGDGTDPVLELSKSFPDIFTIFREGHYAKWSPSKIGHFCCKDL